MPMRTTLAAATATLLLGGAAQAQNWQGFYGGLTLGYGEASGSAIVGNATGGVAGLHLGYNWQTAGAVFGVEIDGVAGNVDVGGVGVREVLRLKARFGVPVGANGLAYGMIGAAQARNNFIPSTDNGLTYGIGYEHMMGGGWSIGAELSGQNFTNVGGIGGADYTLTMLTIRASVRF